MGRGDDGQGRGHDGVRERRGGHPDYHDAGDDPAKMEADMLA
jgi:hypothetical protein